MLLGVVGFGMGFAGSPRQAAALDAIPGDRVGMAAGHVLHRPLPRRRRSGRAWRARSSGTTVTAAGVTLGFGLLVLVGLGVVAVSFGLPDGVAGRAGRVG